MDKNPRLAEQQLNVCLTCDDAPPATYRLLATLQKDSGERETARETLQKGVRRFSHSVALWRSLARIEISLSRHREGISALGTAHRLRPEDEDIDREYRFLLSQYGTEEDRLEAEVHPLLMEAIGRYELDDVPGALEVLTMALRKSQKSPRLRGLVHHRIALVHISLSEPEKAMHHLEAALLHIKDEVALRAETLVSYSDVLLAFGRLDEALKAAKEAVSIEPQSPLAFANMAIAHQMKGNVDGAITAFKDAFSCGLARRLTLRQFLAIGSVEKLRDHPDFIPMVRRAWPSSPYPPEKTN